MQPSHDDGSQSGDLRTQSAYMMRLFTYEGTIIMMEYNLIVMFAVYSLVCSAPLGGLIHAGKNAMLMKA